MSEDVVNITPETMPVIRHAFSQMARLISDRNVEEMRVEDEGLEIRFSWEVHVGCGDYETREIAGVMPWETLMNGDTAGWANGLEEAHSRARMEAQKEKDRIAREAGEARKRLEAARREEQEMETYLRVKARIGENGENSHE